MSEITDEVAIWIVLGAITGFLFLVITLKIYNYFYKKKNKYVM